MTVKKFSGLSDSDIITRDILWWYVCSVMSEKKAIEDGLKWEEAHERARAELIEQFRKESLGETDD